MREISLFLSFLACLGHGWQMEIVADRLGRTQLAERQSELKVASSTDTLEAPRVLVNLLLALTQAAAWIPGISSACAHRGSPRSHPVALASPSLYTGSLAHADITHFYPTAADADETGGCRTTSIIARACCNAGMRVVHSHVEIFNLTQSDTPPGFTGVCLLDASHATSHCYSDTGQLAIDVFTCGAVCPKSVLNTILSDLRAELSPELQVVGRGSAPRFRDAASPTNSGSTDVSTFDEKSDTGSIEDGSRPTVAKRGNRPGVFTKIRKLPAPARVLAPQMTAAHIGQKPQIRIAAEQPQQPQQPQQLTLVEHAMPLAEPHLYEQQVLAAFADRGEVVRWYIARIDELAGTAIAEVVILLHAEGDR